MKFRLIPCLIALLVPTAAMSGVFGYDSFYHCILDKMPGTASDTVAVSVIRICNDKNSSRSVEKSSNWFGGDGVDKCIVKYGKNTPSEMAASQIRTACNRLFER